MRKTRGMFNLMFLASRLPRNSAGVQDLHLWHRWRSRQKKEDETKWPKQTGQLQKKSWLLEFVRGGSRTSVNSCWEGVWEAKGKSKLGQVGNTACKKTTKAGRAGHVQGHGKLSLAEAEGLCWGVGEMNLKSWLGGLREALQGKLQNLVLLHVKTELKVRLQTTPSVFKLNIFKRWRRKKRHSRTQKQDRYLCNLENKLRHSGRPPTTELETGRGVPLLWLHRPKVPGLTSGMGLGSPIYGRRQREAISMALRTGLLQSCFPAWEASLGH